MNVRALLTKIQQNRRMRSFAPWVLLGMAMHLAGFLLLRIEMAPALSLQVIPPFVSWVSVEADAEDNLFREQSLLMDTSILFIPRPSQHDALQWNTPERGYVMRFQPIEPNIRMDTIESVQNIGLSERYAITRPEDLLATRFWRLFDRIGFADLPGPDTQSTAPAGFHMHHWQTFANPIESDINRLPPFADRRGRLLAAPAEMVLHVDERGLIGRPVRLSEPGNREFIDSAQLWLREPSLHYRLAPGSYSIRIFP
jgi:hypothetical protein